MSAFKKWKIKHLSASALNLWLASPAFYSVNYLAGIREGGPAMWRGSAVEVGLLNRLYGKPMCDCHNFAVARFEQEAQGDLDERVQKERANVPLYLEEAARWVPPSTLLGSQLRIDYRLDGIEVPIVGYLDFSFEHADVDLKTTSMLPSKPKPEHIRQVSLYRAARNKKPGHLLYVTTKKHAVYEVTDAMVKQSIKEFTQAASQLERFLYRFDTPYDVLSCMPIDRGSFYWSEGLQKKIDELLEKEEEYVL